MAVLKEADEIQDKTLEALMRIQKNAGETEALGADTLTELKTQGEHLAEITRMNEEVSEKLNRSSALAYDFDKWARCCCCADQRMQRAMDEAAQRILQSKADGAHRTREVFEDQKWNGCARDWRPFDFVLCDAPTVPGPDVHEMNRIHAEGPHGPQAAIDSGSWAVDYNVSFATDSDGWTYCSDFNK